MAGTSSSLCMVVMMSVLAASVLETQPTQDTNVEGSMSLVRVKRQGLSNPQLVPGPLGTLNVPIPTNVAVFGGASLVTDSCPRDEVKMQNGTCQELLMQGNCKVDEYVLLNPENDLGYCAPRLCPPDRIFVFSTQLCHDPRELNLCPPGRELYESSYGTPVCQCPDGTFEGDEDLDDDVCNTLLSQSTSCPADKVFWFSHFDRGPECVADPCNGLNLKRGPNDLPFVPSLINGRCFQLGSSDGVCPVNTWYGLDTQSLKGVCADLEEFGYNVFDAETLTNLIDKLGPTIDKNNLIPIPSDINNNLIQPQIVEHTIIVDEERKVIRTVVPQNVAPPRIVEHTVIIDEEPTIIRTVVPQHVGPQQIIERTVIIDEEPTIIRTVVPQQVATPKPVIQIDQIQHQITVLQQQLNQLQDSLAKNVGNTQSIVTTQSPRFTQNFIEPNQRQGTNLNNDPTSSTVIVRARLESQFSHNPVTDISKNIQVSAPQTNAFVQQQTTSLPSVFHTQRSNFRSNAQNVRQNGHQSQSFPQINNNQRTQQKAINFPDNNKQLKNFGNSNHQQTSNRQQFTVSLKNKEQQNFQQQNHQQKQQQQQLQGNQVKSQQQQFNNVNQQQQSNSANHRQQPISSFNQQQQFVSVKQPAQVRYQQPNTELPPTRQYSQPTAPIIKNANRRLQIQLEPARDFIRIQSTVQQPSSFNRGGHLIKRETLDQQLIGSSSSSLDFDDLLDDAEDNEYIYRVARRVRRSSDDDDTSNRTPKRKRIRRRRTPLPHASPSNVFESRLLGCRGGAIRDINAKCRRVILPPRVPKRKVRAAKPTRPRRSCAGAFNIFRRCVSATNAESSVNGFALG